MSERTCQEGEGIRHNLHPMNSYIKLHGLNKAPLIRL